MRCSTPPAVLSRTALSDGFIDIYAAGSWSSVAAPGFNGGGSGTQLFTGPSDGWLAGPDALGLISATAPAQKLVQWPQANQATLLSVALAPAGVSTKVSGALAVGLDGAALHYDATEGWEIDPVPLKAQGINLLGVAYDGTSSAVAVGAFGTILDWNGFDWSEDPQSVSLTENQLNAVAFAPDGQGWAVGADGTILHYDGTAWSQEQIDSEDSGTDVTSVTVAGGQVFAVAGGNLITRQSDGSWARVDPSLLPADLQSGSLSLVSGLPDGGMVAAGNAVVLIRQNASSPFENTDQPIDGNAVALAAFRDPASGQVRAFVSVAPLNPDAVLTGTGRQRLPVRRRRPARRNGHRLGGSEQRSISPERACRLDSRRRRAGTGPGARTGAVSDGTSAWAVGGYAGTQTAAGLGSSLPLPSRPFAWQTSSIWRYDLGASAQPPTLQQAHTFIPEQDGVVSFAFFSGAECNVECSQVQDAQPDVNLQAASTEIAQFAQQPGGPAFAVLGGNAVGPERSDLMERRRRRGRP